MILDSISVGEILGSWPYDIPRIEMSWTIIQPDFNFRSGETECQFYPKKSAQCVNPDSIHEKSGMSGPWITYYTHQWDKFREI